MKHRSSALLARTGARLKSATNKVADSSPTTRLIVSVGVLVALGVSGAAIQLTNGSDGYTEAERVAAASAQPANGEVLVFKSDHDVSDSLKGMTPRTNGFDPCAGIDEEDDPVLAEASRSEEETEEAKSLSPPGCESEEEREEAEREGTMGPGDSDNPDADSADADAGADSDADADAEGDSGGEAFSLLSSSFPGADVEQKTFGSRPGDSGRCAASTTA